jgi:streptogramin lyase
MRNGEGAGGGAAGGAGVWWRPGWGRGPVPGDERRPTRSFRPGGAGGPDALEERKLMAVQVAAMQAPAVVQTGQALTKGPDGNVWFTEPGEGRVGVMTPSGAVSEVALPDGHQADEGITAGPDGNVWFTESDRVGRVTPSGAVTEFAVPAGASLSGITKGHDGNLWFVDAGNQAVGRITPSGVVTEYPVPGLRALTSAGLTQFYQDITAGPDGNVWFTGERFVGTTGKQAGVVGKVTPAGAVTLYKFPASPPASRAIVRGSQGSGGLLAVAVTAGPDGNVWVTDFQAGGRSGVAKVTPDGTITQYALPTLRPMGVKAPDISTSITAGPDGNLWINLEVDDFLTGPTPDAYLGRVTPNGRVTVFPMPVINNAIQDAYVSEGAESITAGPNNALWFTGSSRRYTVQTGRVIGTVTPPKS